MEKIRTFLIARTPITDAVDVPNWLFIALVVVLVLLIIIIASAIKNSKKDKEKPQSFIKSDGEVIPFFDEEPTTECPCGTCGADLIEEFNKPQETVALEAEPVEQENELATEVLATQKAEVLENTYEAVTAEESIVAISVVESEIAPQTVVIEKEESVIESQPESVEVAVVKEATALAVAEEKKVEEQPVNGAKVGGKFEICNSELGGFRYLLRANNGQLLYESRDYRTARSCTDAIDGFINSVRNGEFSVKKDKFNIYKFVLKSATSNNQIFVGESFDNRTSCLNNIESVKRFAVHSTVVDITEQDFVAVAKSLVIEDSIKEMVKNPNGVVGKWEIEKCEEEEKPYFIFLLYANNGQLLYQSRDYASYATCKNGLATFVKTVEEGNFFIDLDKSGRYKFILRNNSNNSLLDYIGQSYNTKRGAESSAESVYRFALVSPTDKL